MKRFAVVYKETYRRTYYVEAKSFDKACEMIGEAMMEGSIKGPEECCDSCYEDFTSKVSKEELENDYYLDLREDNEECDDIEIETWQDLDKKYPEYRDDMDETTEREFVNDCFELYEKEGFAKKFWSQCGDYKEYHGKPFNVLGRSKEDDVGLCCLPMWDIQFENGHKIAAYPDEIIPREMKDNGCRLDGIE